MIRFESIKKKIAIAANIMLVLNSLLVGGLILPQKAEASAADVVINEVFPNAVGGSPEAEWIEIFNKGTEVESIEGWTLSDSVPTIFATLTGSINPGEYVLLSNTSILNNGGDSITLKDSTDTLIDSVTYDSASEGFSYERSPNGTGAFSWTDAPTPSATNDTPVNQAPEVPVLAAPSDASVNPATVLLDWNASLDPESDPVSYELSVTGPGFNLSQTLSETDYSLDSLVHGDTYSWMVRATDGETPSEWSALWTFTVDSQGPAVTVDNLSTNNTTPTLTGTVDDNAASISVLVNANTYAGTNVGDGTWSAEVTDSLLEGIYNVSVTGTDSLGNIGIDSTNNELTIDDETLPDADMSNLPEAITQETTANITVSGIGVVAYKYEIDGGGYSGANPVGNPISLNGLSEGNHTISVIGIDALSNEEAVIDADSYTWEIDTTAPGDPLVDYTNLVNVWFVNGTNQSTLAIGGTGEAGATLNYTISDSGTGTVSGSGTIDGSGNLAIGSIDVSGLAEGALLLTLTATDTAGNTSDPVFIGGAIKDTIAPQVTVNPLTTNNQFPVLTGTVDDSTNDIDVTVDGSTYDAVNNGDGTWTAVVINILAGDATYDVAVVATDEAGNAGNDLTNNELTIDQTNPVPTITSLSSPGPTNDNPILVSINFSEDVTGFAEEDLTIGNGTINGGSFVQVSPSSYQVGVIPSSNGSVTVDIEASLSQDAAGNGNDVASQLAVEYDGEIPTVDAGTDVATNAQFTQTGTASDPNGIDAVLWSQVSGPEGGTLTFGSDDQLETTIEADVDGVYEASLSVTDNAGNVNVDSFILTWDTTDPLVTIDSLLTNDTTPTLTGTVIENGSGLLNLNILVGGNDLLAEVNGGTWTIELTTPLAEGVHEVFAYATDNVGNQGEDSSINELEVDVTAPTISEFITVPTPTNNNTPSFVFISDEAGSIVYGGDCLSDTNSAISGGNPVTFNTLVDGIYANCSVQVTDAAGNPSNLIIASAFTIDTLSPSVVLSTTASDPTNVSPIPVTAEFSEDIFGFDVTDITVSNGNAGNLIAVDGNTYTFDVTPSADGFVTVDVLAGVATDLATNLNNMSNQIALVYDSTAPTLLETNPVTFLTNDNTPDYGFNSTEAGSISYGGDCTSGVNLATAGENTLTFDMLADGLHNNCTIQITDAAGNQSDILGVFQFIVDTTPPVVNAGPDVVTNVQIEQDASANDPTSDIGSFAWSQITGPGTAIFGSANSEDTQVSADVDGVYTLRLTVTDNAGNSNSDDFELTWDITDPTVTVDSLLTNDANPTITGTVSDDVSGIEKVDVTVNGITYNAEIDGDTWSVDVTGNAPVELGGLSALVVDPSVPLADGTYSVVAVATDNAGNTSTDVTDNELTIDTVNPVITVDLLETNDNTPTITGTVDDENTEITVIVDGEGYPGVVGGNTWSADISGSQSQDLSVQTVNGLADGVYDVTINASDLAGNEILGQIFEDVLMVDTVASKVTNLTATPGNNSVVLGWTNPTEADFMGVRIFRDGTEITSALTTASTYTDATAVNGTTYTYDVYTYDEVGNKSEKVSVSAKPVAPAITPVPVVATTTTTTTTSPDATPPSDKVKEEIKSATDEIKPAEEEKKDIEVKDEKKFPVWGIVLLLILAGFGGYLFYAQKPEAPASSKKKK